MKNVTSSILIILIVLTGCKSSNDNSESNVKIPVTIAGIRTSTITNYLDLSGISLFLSKAQIKATASGYVADILVNPGSTVTKGQLLFSLKTKEAAAISGDSLNQLNFSGLIQIKAASDGIVSSIERAKGDYIMEGDPLCQIAVPGSLVFVLDVPVELANFVKVNNSCEIMLTDGRQIKGRIKSRYPSLSGTSQTEQYMVQLDEKRDLPENFIAKIRIVKSSISNAVSLPKSCVLTDEMMQSYWVMKLVNDSTAVKVLVKTGLDNGENIQIVTPAFNNSDSFLATGNYGLGDTACIKIIK